MSNIINKSMRIPDIGLPRIVVIGGGFAGVEAVRALKDLDAQVVLFDKYNFHTFQPLLYQVGTAGLEADSIVYPLRKVFDRQKNFFFRLADVTAIYPTKNEVHTSIGNLHYDYLIIATGATTNFYGNQQLIKNCLPLKSIDDAIHLRNKILNNFEQALLTDNEDDLNSLMDYVVVGGGPTGVEVSGALGELKLHVLPIDYPELDFRKMDVHLIQSAPRLLPAMSEISSKKAYDYLRKFEVDIWLNTRVLSYDGYFADLSDGQRVITKTMIWAAGIMGQPIEGLDEKSKGPGSRIKVDEYNRVLGHENIFAIGDVACMISDKYPNGHPQMAQPAMQMGQKIGENIVNMIRKKPLTPFIFKDPGSMATVGRNKAVVEIGKYKTQGFFAWFIWMFVHLIAVVGYRNRFVVFVNWMVSYLSYDKGIRLIIGDEKKDAKLLEKRETLEADI